MQATTADTKFAFQATFRAALSDLWAAREGGAYRGVFWYGAPGTGKTHTARDFCGWVGERQLISKPDAFPPCYAARTVFDGSALELVAETQAAIGRNKEARSLWEMIEEVKRADVAFFDDLGREREDYGQSVMFTLLDTALAHGVFTIVTANRNAKELADYYKGDAGLRSRLSALKQQEWGADLPNLRKPE